MAKRVQKTFGRNSDPKRPRRTVQIDLTADDNINMGFVPNTLSTDRLNPKRPTSQAAAMAAEPSEDLISTVEAFSGCTRTVAVRALKVKNNDTQAAINAIFEGEDLEKLESDLGWSEHMMSSVQPLGTSAAPTRGNSPARSMQPSTQNEEDAQMAAAMANSQQETGVVNADGTSFGRMIGPPNQYQNNEWAMVKFGAQELLADVEIAQRVQDKDAAEPRLLKHLTDGDYTPNLLTICNAIPAAREGLLMQNWLKNDYGFDEGWWRGQPISTPTVVHISDGSPADTLTDKHEELIAEVQRLMAFLDSSDRIYASTGGLTETKMIKEHNLTSGSLLELFLTSWTTAAETKNTAISGLFTTKMGTSANEGMDTPNLAVVEISVQSEGGANKDLSELLDDLVWDQDLSEDNYIEQPADILVVTLKQADPKLKQVSVDVPASLHLDKYLQENIASSRELRKEMAQARSKIAKIEAIEKKLTTWSYYDSKKAEAEKAKTEQERKDNEKEKDQIGPKQMTSDGDQIDSDGNNARVGVKDMLAHSLAHFSGENRKDEEASDTTSTIDPPEFADIAAKLERIMTTIEDKLKVLSVNKEKARSLLSDLSKSTPSSADTGLPKHRYTLRGVATKPSITYVLSPKSNNDVEMADSNAAQRIDLDDTTPAGMQWWRLAYESNGSNASILRTKAADYDVLRAVELEHDSALLVYASDHAMDQPTTSASDLPEPLQQFIQRDNHQFKLDLAAARRDPPGHDYFEVQNSIERKGSGSSTGAIAAYSPPAEEIHLSPEPDDVEMMERPDAKPLTLTNPDVALHDETANHDVGAEDAQHIEDAQSRMED